MENNNENKFPEQKAPEKNHDNAFVQVGEDGSPVIPETGGSEGEELRKQNEQADNSSTLGTP
ncbi:hypothetical protein [Aridibaculum aurantiacum]|uniref:hypothetical protein n=1 Tax=Aridibaculum aurantiacum TaxID=2810307 RepID=UPI001A963558|nr:hypothetical protein [Aridibaculum aurantiacum]